LKKLFDVLRRNDNYIDNLTPWDHFRPPDFEPIRWTNDIVLLQHLIQRKLKIAEKSIWVKLASLFVDKNGKALNPRTIASTYSQAKPTK